ncbi:MAG: UDP-N-acetylmuramate dehydrogenase [Bacteroidota bacterium]
MPVLRPRVSLRSYNTFGLEATARWWMSLESEKEAVEFLVDNFHQYPNLHILGGGSNILLTQDIKGLVVKNDLKGLQVVREDDRYVWLEIGAGENWHHTVLYCLDRGWGGIENLSLIPGSVGAAPMQNIGAYGVELESVFEHLEAIHLPSGNIRRFDRKACEFGYRSSVFKHRLKHQYMITRVCLRLHKKHELITHYGAIEQGLAALEGPVGIREVSQVVCDIRRSKLPDPAEIGNSGSFFKNPIISPEAFVPLHQTHPDIPHYPQADGQIKLAAGWLIQEAGWKGYRKGDAGVHARQALVLVNYGEAKGSEILQLSQDIQASVQSTFGVALEREVNVW